MFHNKGKEHLSSRKAVESFQSVAVSKSSNILIVCRFHPTSSSVLAVCDELGYISINTAHSLARKDPPLKVWRAHKNVIMDIEWLGGKLLTGSGDQTLALWDVESGVRVQPEFRGHKGTIKSISTDPDQPSIFCSGGRGGSLCLWDLRCKVRTQKASSNGPVIQLNDCHVPAVHLHHPSISNHSIIKRVNDRRRQALAVCEQRWQNCACPDTSQPAVTAVKFVNAFSILTSSSSVESGIRVWDMRKPKNNLNASVPVPVTMYKYPKLSQKFGFSSVTFDRYRNFIFAACTDHTIYQYCLSTTNVETVGQLEGAAIGSFYIRMATAPFGDFLVSGNSKNGCALVWDVSGTHHSTPWLSLGGHTSEVASVDWNRRGDLLATCEDNQLRLWQLADDGGRPITAVGGHRVERAELYRVTDNCSSLDVSSTSLTTTNYPSMNSNKRKLAFRSPFKDPMCSGNRATCVDKENDDPLRSPCKKLVKLTDNNTTDGGKSSHYRYPTTGLPNLVLDDFMKHRREPHSVVDQKLAEKTACRLKDWLAGSSGGTGIQQLPKKLPITPQKTEGTADGNTDDCAVQPGKRRLVQKTLFDYFCNGDRK